MSISKQIDLVRCLSLLVSKMKKSIEDKFADFYIKRIFDLNLAPSKIFTYYFGIGSSSSSIHAKSVAKLKSLILKHLEKINPFICLGNLQFLSGEISNTIILNMFNVELGDKLPSINYKWFSKLHRELQMEVPELKNVSMVELSNSSTLKHIFFESIAEMLVLNRYVRYLNYIARKYNIPVLLKVCSNLVSDANLKSTYLKYLVNIDIAFVKWIPLEGSLERYNNVQNQNFKVEDDNLFSNATLWRSVSLNSVIVNTSSYHISKLFLHLDKAIKVLTTLSRKVEYGYSAFNFRTI